MKKRKIVPTNSNKSPESNRPQPQNNTKVNIDSTKVVLDIVLKEYDYETARDNSINTRASTFLSVSAAVFALVANAIKIPKNLSTILTSSLITLYACILVTLGLTIYFFARTLTVRGYKRYQISELVKLSEMKKEPSELMPIVAATISKIIKENSLIADLKVAKYNHGILMLRISVIFIGVIMIILTLNSI